MISEKYEKVRQNVASVYANPQEIVEATDLSLEQKVDLLKQWEQDLRQLLLASEEGMSAQVPGQAGEMLRKVEMVLNGLIAS